MKLLAKQDCDTCKHYGARWQDEPCASCCTDHSKHERQVDAKQMDCASRQAERGEEKTMYECFHCGAKAVIWSADFMFEEYGVEGNGIVHVCHCTHCGADLRGEDDV